MVKTDEHDKNDVLAQVSLDSKQKGACNPTVWKSIGDSPVIHTLPSVSCDVSYSDFASGGREEHKMQVRNGRSAPDMFTLDDSGFQLLTLERPLVAVFTDPKSVEEQIYPEVVRYITGATGAKRVLVFDQVFRNAERLRPRQNGSIDSTPLCESACPPLMFAHNDYTVHSGFTRARQVLSPYLSGKVIDGLLSRRFAIINFWYPIRPVMSTPLAMCLWGSFQPGDLQALHRATQLRAQVGVFFMHAA
eukprot:gnl/MRDRNA2_/MRDRNA2_67819_c0_seq2.p1 gnl/MRDRNA2_/MRDRNA2_67819_c0~~gnl/MRDRNA2_/MRDRNA2_67819_c0_seq2.p1  ORF type:complete len:247 (-),score=30.19 gnl/MRDRNA2_/MRDRNA2_67819_c0_seq2:165-905(-)